MRREKAELVVAAQQKEERLALDSEVDSMKEELQAKISRCLTDIS